jgi:hypothetical protein
MEKRYRLAELRLRLIGATDWKINGSQRMAGVSLCLAERFARVALEHDQQQAEEERAMSTFHRIAGVRGAIADPHNRFSAFIAVVVLSARAYCT